MNLSLFQKKRAAVASAFAIGIAIGTAATGLAASLGSSIFDDVEPGSFYDEAVGEMYADGIIKGYDGTKNFGPNDPVTRGQIAVSSNVPRD